MKKSKWTLEFKREYGRNYRKTYYQAHKDEIKKYATMYRKKFPQKHASYVKNTWKNNPTKYNKAYFNECCKRAYHKNKELYRMYSNFQYYFKKDKTT